MDLKINELEESIQEFATCISLEEKGLKMNLCYRLLNNLLVIKKY
jgi:hypothetical protein